jgi:hypothetical protein
MRPAQVRPHEVTGTTGALISGTLTAKGTGLGGKALVNITARQAELSHALATARDELDAIHRWQLQWEDTDTENILDKWGVLAADDLAGSIKATESWMEEIRNRRQEFQTMFENLDQKTNQLFNLLSQVLKQIKEMRSAVTRNMQ